MVLSIWQTLFGNPASTNRPVKRVVRGGRQWEFGTERLEERALLSAVPVAAEVVHSKAAFTVPNVAGTWDVELTGFGTGSAVFTQKGAKVTATISLSNSPDIKVSGKFTKKHPNSIEDTNKLTLPVVGTVVIKTNIVFPNGNDPSTFSGTALVKGRSVNITGEKQVQGTSSLPKIAKVSLPDISGQWLLTGIAVSGSFEDALLNITQSGKTGKSISGTATFTGGSFSFTGKLRPNGHMTGKADIQLGEITLAKQRYFADFTDDFLTFSGEVNLKKADDLMNIDGEVAV